MLSGAEALKPDLRIRNEVLSLAALGETALREPRELLALCERLCMEIDTVESVFDRVMWGDDDSDVLAARAARKPEN